MLQVNEFNNFNLIENAWKKLREQLKINVPFLYWEWQKTWDEIFKSKNLSIFEIIENNNTIGICSLKIESNIARWSCGEEVSDYLDILSSDKDNKQIWIEIINNLRNKKIKRIELRNLMQSSKSITSLQEISNKLNLAITINKEDVVPFILLPSTFEEYLKILDRKDRHELRRKIRRFNNEVKNWKILKSNKDNLEKDCDNFFSLFKKGNIKKKNFLSKEMEQFFCKVFFEMEKNNLLDFSILMIENKIAAETISFTNADTLYLYNQTTNLKFYHLSPGLILNKFLIEESIIKKRKIYDFMQGSERYKYQLGAKDNFVYKIVINL